MSNQSVLQRLLRSTHRAVFDKDADADLALRVRSPGGLLWAVADNTLTITAGGHTFSYNLLTRTLEQLAADLATDGFEVAYQNGDIRRRGARTLVEGVGNQDQSNGDHLWSYTSLLWTLFNGYGLELDQAEYQVGQALRQMVMPQAEGEWLDLWAGLYGVPRLSSEADSALQARIPQEVFRKRLNALAMQKSIKQQTGKDVVITEPWKLMFRLDYSAMSGTHHLHDGRYYAHHVIQPVSTVPIDWTGPLAVINRDRAAGVVVADPVYAPSVIHVRVGDTVTYTVGVARTDYRFITALRFGENPLGVMKLDDNVFAFNHQVIAYQIRTYANTYGLQEYQDIPTPRRVAYASIALSWGPPLGDENAIFPRGQERYLFTPSPGLSNGLALDGYTVVDEIRRVERVVLEDHAYGALVNTATWTGSYAQAEVFSFIASAYAPNNWTGPWATRPWRGWRTAGMTMTTSS